MKIKVFAQKEIKYCVWIGAQLFHHYLYLLICGLKAEYQ